MTTPDTNTTAGAYIASADQLIREASEAVAGVHDPRDRLAQHVGYLQGTVRSLCAHYTGCDVKPQAGCSFARLAAGDAQVLVEYEYTPPERDRRDDAIDFAGAAP